MSERVWVKVGDDTVLCVEDGFGSRWMCCPDERCDLQVVRPGKAQCSNYCQEPSS